MVRRRVAFCGLGFMEYLEISYFQKNGRPVIALTRGQLHRPEAQILCGIKVRESRAIGG